jgi:2-succinyl-6-hydroxy-2,4-cyclohexadiene-1-carboxylate synthase
VLATRHFGSGAPLVALHGFTHTGEQYKPLAEAISHEIHAPDLPGHGESVDESAQIDDVVTSLAVSIGAAGEAVPVLGYSQGARLAILLATRTSSVTGPLIIVSGTAGIENPEDRRDRREWDRSTAEKIIEIGIERFIDRWTASGMTSTQGLPPALRRSDREQRLTNTAHGLASALTGYGTGVMPSVWHLLDSITVPTLILTGSRDAAYTAFGARIAASIGGNASHHVVDDAGHDPFLTNQAGTVGHLKEFLAEWAIQPSSMGTADPDDQS